MKNTIHTSDNLNESADKLDTQRDDQKQPEPISLTEKIEAEANKER
jgi:hypothetical protein